MSRIRSIHPGLFTDEAFVSLSPMARIFLMGVWTECDDYGSFEWNPRKLKMRILPADNADTEQLLEEIELAGIVLRYEIDGRTYGAVKNFCKYQRPRRPSQVFPQTDKVQIFVLLSAWDTRNGASDEDEFPTKSGNSNAKAKQIPTKSEIARQMEDGDVNRRVKSPPSPPSACPERFDEFWEAYPKRAGHNPKAVAASNFNARLKEGIPADVMIDAAKRYRAFIEAQGKQGTEFVMQASSFLGPKSRGFENPWDPPPETKRPQAKPMGERFDEIRSQMSRG